MQAWQAPSEMVLTEELAWRGLIHQTTEHALEAIDAGPLVVYAGFDPTADSLTIGHLLQLCTLRRFQQAGHRVIALAGGATGMVGDPSGKSEERSLLSDEELTSNVAAIKKQMERFLDLDGERGVLADNRDWLGSIGFLEFLRDVGKHFTVNQMVAKESIRTRFTEREQGISFTEFSYMLLQAADFLELFDRHGCRLQIGGSDQWGNITMGVELIRKRRSTTAHALTTPLVTKADGTKFGKTEAGAVWLDAARTSPWELWQFLFNAEDTKVGEYLRMFTWLDRDEIAELDRSTAENPGRRAAQRAVANIVTALVHGDAAAKAVENAAAVLFSDRVVELDADTLGMAVAGAPSAELPADGISVVDGLIALGFVDSRGKGRSLVEQGGVHVNGVKQSDGERVLTGADAIGGRYVLLRKGRRDQGVLVSL